MYTHPIYLNSDYSSSSLSVGEGEFSLYEILHRNPDTLQLECLLVWERSENVIEIRYTDRDHPVLRGEDTGPRGLCPPESQLRGPELLIRRNARSSVKNCPKFIRNLGFMGTKFRYSEHYGTEFVQDCGALTRTEINLCPDQSTAGEEDPDGDNLADGRDFVVHFGACNRTDLEFR